MSVHKLPNTIFSRKTCEYNTYKTNVLYKIKLSSQWFVMSGWMFIVHTFAHVHDRPSQFSAPLSYEQRLFPRWPALSTIISKSFTCDLKKKWNCLMVCSVRKRWKMTQFGTSPWYEMAPLSNPAPRFKCESALIAFKLWCALVMFCF